MKCCWLVLLLESENRDNLWAIACVFHSMALIRIVLVCICAHWKQSVLWNGMRLALEGCSCIVSFPDPPTHTLPLPLNYRNVEMKNMREGSGK